MAESSERNLLQMPSEIISHVLLYLSYDQISNVRLVSKKFDAICQQLLNQGFSQVDKYHSYVQKEVKAQLPRRESERRVHHLARHVDILSAIETRLSLLSMTYMKYVTSGICCFIPGKVIDEIFSVLRYLKANQTPPHSHELLRELRDISSMAMEHFDEKIAPRFRGQIKSTNQTSMSEPRPGVYSKYLDGASSCAPGALLQQPGTSNDGLPATPVPQMRLPSLRKDIMRLQQQMRACSSALITSKKDVADVKKKLGEQNTKIQDQNKKIVDQNRLIAEQFTKIAEQDQKISDLTQRLTEYGHKFVSTEQQLREGEEVLVKDAKDRRNKETKCRPLKKRKCAQKSDAYECETPIAKRTRARLT